MEAKKKNTFIAVLAFGLFYFILFIFPNRIGAQDINMLALFEVDEFAFYPHVIHMLSPGGTAYQTLRNFLIYLQYFYGYPFFFFSALTLLPVKWLAGSGWQHLTQLNITLLRQMLSVLPALISAALLVYMQTRFRWMCRSLALFILLLCIPGVVGNNMFWHPDGLSLLSIVLTFFFLQRDDTSFGRNFYLAAAVCGVAVGIKSQGFFFFLAIPLYIVCGVLSKRLNWQNAVLKAMVFVAVMIAALIASNPLLLLPIERAEIISVQTRNLAQLAQGFMVKTGEPYFTWGAYPDDFRIHYGELFFVLLALAALALGIIRPERRLLHLMILAFIAPMLLSMNYSGTRRTHYFLPVMLPLVSCLVNLFPACGRVDGQQVEGKSDKKAVNLNASVLQYAKKALPYLFGALVALQFVLFVRSDIEMISKQLKREADSQSIAFYYKLDDMYFSKLDAAEKLVIYRDWRVYIPFSRDDWRVEMNWDLADYDTIGDLQPDLILLEMENVKLFTQAGIVEQASDPERMQAWQDFYGDALEDRLPGYRMLLQDHFGLALVKE